MSQQTINLGAAPNDGTGDSLRVGGTKINANFTELYALVAAIGASWKLPVRVATTAAGTLATGFENGDVVDGVTLVTGDRILIKNQAAGAENGIYVVAASGAPVRAVDADAGSELVNAAALIGEGAVNADRLFVCTTNAPITLGSTALVFGDFTPPAAYTDAMAQAAIHAAPTTIAGTAHTLVIGNAYGYLRTTNAAAVTLTVPPNSSVAFVTGTTIAFRQAGAGLATLVAGAGVTLNSRGGLLASAGQHAGFQIKKVATDEWDVWGDVA